jgi:hypothetical protein
MFLLQVSQPVLLRLWGSNNKACICLPKASPPQFPLMSYVTCFLICCSYLHVGLPLGCFHFHIHSFCHASLFDHSHYLWSTYCKLIVLLAWKGSTTLPDSVCENVKCIFFFCWNMEIDSFPFFMMDLLIPVSVCWKTLVYVNYVHSKWNSKVFTDHVSAEIKWL